MWLLSRLHPNLWSCVLCSKGPFILSAAIRHEDSPSHCIKEHAWCLRQAASPSEPPQSSPTQSIFNQPSSLITPHQSRFRSPSREPLPDSSPLPYIPSEDDDDNNPFCEGLSFVSPGPQLPTDPGWMTYNDFGDDGLGSDAEVDQGSDPFLPDEALGLESRLLSKRSQSLASFRLGPGAFNPEAPDTLLDEEMEDFVQSYYPFNDEEVGLYHSIVS